METTKRHTIQRALVLEAVRAMHTHPTSAEVYDVVREEHPNISRATVYRNLAVLSDMGEILHIRVPGGADRYDFRRDCHYHGVCRGCGAVCDVEMPAGFDLAGNVSDAHGFAIEDHALVFSGLCEECAREAAPLTGEEVLAASE